MLGLARAETINEGIVSRTVTEVEQDAVSVAESDTRTATIFVPSGRSAIKERFVPDGDSLDDTESVCRS